MFDGFNQVLSKRRTVAVGMVDTAAHLGDWYLECDANAGDGETLQIGQVGDEDGATQGFENVLNKTISADL
jgi:hypothetical protein